MSEDKKPKLSSAIKKELQIETKFTIGRILWPLFTILIFAFVGYYLFTVYGREKGKTEVFDTKTPEEKIENRPDITDEQREKERLEAEEAAKKAAEAEQAATTAPAATETTTPTTTNYTVEEGDTLGAIATANGLTIAEVTAVNPGLVAENLQIGQVIKIPKK